MARNAALAWTALATLAIALAGVVYFALPLPPAAGASLAGHPREALGYVDDLVESSRVRLLDPDVHRVLVAAQRELETPPIDSFTVVEVVATTSVARNRLTVPRGIAIAVLALCGIAGILGLMRSAQKPDDPELHLELRPTSIMREAISLCGFAMLGASLLQYDADPVLSVALFAFPALACVALTVAANLTSAGEAALAALPTNRGRRTARVWLGLALIAAGTAALVWLVPSLPAAEHEVHIGTITMSVPTIGPDATEFQLHTLPAVAYTVAIAFGVLQVSVNLAVLARARLRPELG